MQPDLEATCIEIISTNQIIDHLWLLQFRPPDASPDIFYIHFENFDLLMIKNKIYILNDLNCDLIGPNFDYLT